MKKFAIISIILLLIGGTAFGVSVWHYIDVMHPFDRQPAENVSATEAPRATADSAVKPLNTGDAPASNSVPDGELFEANYEKAKKAVEEMTAPEMAGQLVVGVCSDLDSGSADLTQYGLSGYLLESSAFTFKTADEIKTGLLAMSEGASIKPILAAQEEGGAVTTVSDAPAFGEYSFDSPRNILAISGMQEVEKTELEKATLLKSLGFNVNLAPVVDLADSYDQIMYSRAIAGDLDTVTDFAKYCAKHVQAKGISVALKHFPGYGSVPDSASYEAAAAGTAIIDTRDAATLRANDYEPFKAGVSEGAHFVMVSNVVVESLDANHTAALSSAVHQELREVVGFTGLIITDIIDDADYSAYADGKNVAVAAVLAGNDLILSRNYGDSYNAILAAVNDGTISESLLKETCTRVLAYKYTAGLIK